MAVDVGERPTFGPGLTKGEIDAVRHYGAALVAYEEECAKVDAATGQGRVKQAGTELYPLVVRRDAARYILDEARAALDALMRQRFCL